MSFRGQNWALVKMEDVIGVSKAEVTGGDDSIFPFQRKFIRKFDPEVVTGHNHVPNL